jgi:D-alanyl-D-alanine carboxypeptidase
VLPRPLHRTLGAMAPVLALAVALPLVVASTASARFRPEIFAAIVIDADSGEVLYDNQSQAVLYPASLTKMMTLYLVFENLDKKRLRLDEDIAISATAASREPAKLGLPAGAVLPLEDAILALTTKSANDIATALAERLAGTEPNFAMVMQAKAHELGMEDTQFRNASGLPDGEHYSSARDMATLARALIRDYPQYYHYFSARSFQFQGIDYANQNRLLGNYPGADGIKTGYIKASGHNLAASAVRDGKRLIGVVFGGPTLNWTRQRMTELLDEAFGAPSPPPIRAAASCPEIPSSRSKRSNGQRPGCRRCCRAIRWRACWRPRRVELTSCPETSCRRAPSRHAGPRPCCRETRSTACRPPPTSRPPRPAPPEPPKRS